MKRKKRRVFFPRIRIFGHVRKDVRRYALMALAAALCLAALATLLSAKTKRGEESIRGEYAPLTREEIAYALSVDPPSDAARKALVEAAVSLVGEVSYFWGGKSTARGFDPAWGALKAVESPGSRTTGSVRPYGLDCSGYVLWCFIQLGYDAEEANALVGIGTWKQWERSYDIDYSALRPGDLAFEKRYPEAKANHVGICVGFDEQGQPVFAHCAASLNGVVVTSAGSVFRHARRPFLFYAAEEGGLAP